MSRELQLNEFITTFGKELADLVKLAWEDGR